LTSAAEGANVAPGGGRARVATAKARTFNVAPPNHLSNQKLQDVWLSED